MTDFIEIMVTLDKKPFGTLHWRGPLPSQGTMMNLPGVHDVTVERMFLRVAYTEAKLNKFATAQIAEASIECKTVT